MPWKELSKQLKIFHGLGKFVAATVYQGPTVMTQKRREGFYSKFLLAIKIFTASPGVLSESDLLKRDRLGHRGQENACASATLVPST